MEIGKIKRHQMFQAVHYVNRRLDEFFHSMVRKVKKCHFELSAERKYPRLRVWKSSRQIEKKAPVFRNGLWPLTIEIFWGLLSEKFNGLHKQSTSINKYNAHFFLRVFGNSSYSCILLFITSILKSLVVPVIWLAQIGAIYSQIALNCTIFCSRSHHFSSQWETCFKLASCRGAFVSACATL